MEEDNLFFDRTVKNSVMKYDNFYPCCIFGTGHSITRTGTSMDYFAAHYITVEPRNCRIYDGTNLAQAFVIKTRVACAITYVVSSSRTNSL